MPTSVKFTTFWEKKISPGVPVPNGSRHASEIAHLSLELLAMIRQNPYLVATIRLPLQLYIGVCTGELFRFVWRACRQYW